MATIIAQIAPQRSTQYAALASVLAPHELKPGSLGGQISDIRLVRLGGQECLKFDQPG